MESQQYQHIKMEPSTSTPLKYQSSFFGKKTLKSNLMCDENYGSHTNVADEDTSGPLAFEAKMSPEEKEPKGTRLVRRKRTENNAAVSSLLN